MMFCYYYYCVAFLPVSFQKESLSMATRHSFPWDLFCLFGFIIWNNNPNRFRSINWFIPIDQAISRKKFIQMHPMGRKREAFCAREFFLSLVPFSLWVFVFCFFLVGKGFSLLLISFVFRFLFVYLLSTFQRKVLKERRGDLRGENKTRDWMDWRNLSIFG